MKYVISIVLCTVAVIAQSRAADILVGPQHEVADLQSAVARANDGDRILVEPGNYLGNVSIDKSITMLPRQEGTRYTVQGRVYCGGASGKRILLSGIRVLTAVQVQSILTERLDLVIVDSYLFSFQGTQNQPLLRVELYRDSIGQASWSLGSCAIIGCRFLESNGGVLQAISIQNTSLPETNDIIGNIFQGIGDIMCAIDITNANRPFHIENNLVIGPLHFLRLTGGGLNAPMPMSTIINNTFIDTGNDGVSMLLEAGNIYYALLVKNNARIGTGPIAAITNATPSALPFVVFTNNVEGPPSSVDGSTGMPSMGSPLINAGDPDPRYMDLDLSINDAGCYGGSNSLVNYSTPQGSAVVAYMRAPRVIPQGSPVNIQAIGFDR
jgi:hypothetical protein